MPQNAPKELCCPITHKLFKDPVCAADGHTYERAAIEKHFLRKITSPLTENELDHTNLVPNILIRRRSIEWKERNKNSDMNTLWLKCFQVRNPVHIVEVITKMVELVVKSDTCILPMFRLSELKSFFLRIGKFTNDVESKLHLLSMSCKEKRDKGIQDICKIKKIKKVCEETITKKENALKKSNDALKKSNDAVEIAKKKVTEAKTIAEKKVTEAKKIYADAVEIAKKKVTEAKKNAEKKETEAGKIYADAVEIAKKKETEAGKIYAVAKANMSQVNMEHDDVVGVQEELINQLNDLKKLAETFKEEEIRLSDVLDSFDDKLDENVPPTTSGKKRKATSLSSNVAVKRQKIKIKRARNVFEVGFAKLHGCNFQTVDRDNGKRMIEYAATAGFPTAIALCTYNGWNCFENDYEKQFKVIMDSSDYSYAQYYIGFCHFTGTGVAQDKEEAFKWWTKSANAGHSKAQFYIGDCYLYGNTVAKDKEEAFKWYTKAANAGYCKAQYILGNCYFHGICVAEDKKEAIKWYTKSANAGNCTAQNSLGSCYDLGNGVAEDKKEASKWYSKSANAGNDVGQFCLANSYLRGHGFAEDKKEAIKWYTKSANAGNCAAQCDLGTCYFNGEGVAIDKNEAKKWWSKSAAGGSDVAKEMLQSYFPPS